MRALRGPARWGVFLVRQVLALEDLVRALIEGIQQVVYRFVVGARLQCSRRQSARF